jgi:hypothetical protein
LRWDNPADESFRSKSRSRGFIAKVNAIQAQKFLGGIEYPTSKDEIVGAEQNGPDKNVLDVLRHIPDRQYDYPNAVSHEISEAQ